VFYEPIISLQKKLWTYTKKEIIEDIGIHFESLYQVPPLAARIIEF
jgi:hypothetical protein